MLEWLFAPMDASRIHDVGWSLSWHARVMVAAWGILVPVGILSARYFKILPGQNWPHRLDSRLWWNTHRICQYLASILMVFGLWLIWNTPPSDATPGPHGYLGWTILTLALAQILGGILRGTKGGPTEPASDGSLSGDHYDMTRRRLVFEYVHKILGYAALALSVVTILSGLWQANAPNWMWLTLSVWWTTLACTTIALQRRGMSVDTYQAIWGPDPALPGNRRTPVGWGIKRPPPHSSTKD